MRATSDQVLSSFESFEAWLREELPTLAAVDIGPETTLREDAALDAFDLYRLLRLVEEMCGERFPNELWDTIRTFGDLYYFALTKSGHA